MANYVVSDPRDWEVWQTNHDHWRELVSAEMEHRAGRPPDWYRELLKLVGKKDLTTLATSGSSTSTLTPGQAFERGYFTR